MLLNYMLMSRDMFISPKDLPITYKMNGQKLIAELFQPQRIDRPSMVDVRNIVVIKMQSKVRCGKRCLNCKQLYFLYNFRLKLRSISCRRYVSAMLQVCSSQRSMALCDRKAITHLLSLICSEPTVMISCSSHYVTLGALTHLFQQCKLNYRLS